MSNVYLVGMMGSGKSAAGMKLAPMLKATFVDLDEKVEQKVGQVISEIFAHQGEAFFRLQESICLEEAIQSNKNAVIATGGGVVLTPNNVKEMKASGRVVYLEASAETLWERIRAKKNRPLLSGGDPQKKLQTIYEDRKSFYENACDCRVQTDGKSVEETAKNIAATLGNLK